MNNILVIIPDCLQNPMGGMGEQANNILNIIPKYKFFVIGSNNQKEEKTGNIHYMPVMDISSYSGDPDPLSMSFLNQSLYVQKALSSNIKPDIVHAFDWSTFWAGRILSRHFNVPLIVTVQLSLQYSIEQIHPLQELQYNMGCAIEMSGLIEADRVIQVSSSYAKLFPLLNKTVIIENGIDLDKWVQTEKINLPGTRKHKLIYIGRFAEMKNIQTLIRCKIPDEIDLIFIGSTRGGAPELHQAVVDFANANDNVHYIGPKYGQEKINWLMSADAVIVPSVHEPFGIVALEALASRSILLSSFVNGMGDFLNENCAINCGTTKESIENSMKKLIELGADEKNSYICNGIKLCKEYSWKKQAQKLENVYDEVLNG
jgi:1,4-alpha-glucan branching enzyme